MFRSAIAKLTASYLVIIMALSISFSVLLYRAYSNELASGLKRQGVFMRNLTPEYGITMPLPDRLEEWRSNQLEDSRRRLIFRLVYFNLLVLSLGGVTSYLLARYTLKPIEEAHEDQKRFSADASHELRTPLAVMRTEIEVALRERDITKVELRSLLESNLEEVDKLVTLSNSLLTLSRQESANPLQKSICNLEAAFNQARDRVKQAAELKKIKYKTNFQETAILADCASLVELIVILLDNAIKYSQEGKEITFQTKSVDGGILLEMQDQGTGIKATEIPHIFDRFYRAESSRSKEKINGFGLGLSIAKAIVERHQGKISVESTPGQGTCFLIYLPQLPHIKVEA